MKTMPKSTKEEKFRWIKPILDKEISIKNMVRVCPFSERSLKYWLVDYRKSGLEGLENKSKRPKTNPRETPIRIKERIIELRKETKKCALPFRAASTTKNILIMWLNPSRG
ncbi:MAG: helix-turn-helix domain-containing protein [Candidatus Niyogibacteria bacterium]|nr:helix-turn-helix domain-containing protein [Candidatus Niyogibacteria bacterium]